MQRAALVLGVLLLLLLAVLSATVSLAAEAPRPVGYEDPAFTAAMNDPEVKQAGLLEVAAKFKESAYENGEINMNGVPLTPAGIDAVIDRLSERIHTVSLMSTRLRASTLRQFLKAVDRAPNLTKLDVSDNWLEDESARDLAVAFAQMPKLKHLNIGYNHFGNEAIRIIGDALGSLPQLEELKIIGGWDTKLNPEGGKILGERLKNAPKLRSLVLKAQRLRNNGVQALANFLDSVPELRELDLSGVDMGQVGARSLSSLLKSVPKLEVLDLSNNPLKDKSLKYILKSLSTFPNLRVLSLERVELGVAGLRELTEQIPHLKQLEKLVLSNNELRDKVMVPFLEALKANSKLRALILNQNKCEMATCLAVARGISSWPELEELNIGGIGCFKKGTEELSQALVAATKLKKLTMNAVQMEEWGLTEFLKHWSKLPAIESLDISGNYFADPAGRALTTAINTDRPPTLSHLEIFGSDSYEKSTRVELVCAIVRHLKKTVRLDLSGANLKDDSMRALARCLRDNSAHIEFFGIGSNGVTPDGVRDLPAVIGTMSRLEVLDIRNNPLTDKGVVPFLDQLRHLPRMAAVYFSDCEVSNESIDKFAENLQYLPNLFKFDITGNTRISDGAFRYLAKHLKDAPTLKEIVMERMDLSTEALKAFADVLHEVPGLAALDFGRNKGIGDAGAVYFTQKAIQLPFATHIILRETGLSDAAAEGIAKVLDEARAFKILIDISENNIRDLGGRALLAKTPNSASRLRRLMVNLRHTSLTEHFKTEAANRNPLFLL